MSLLNSGSTNVILMFDISVSVPSKSIDWLVLYTYQKKALRSIYCERWHIYAFIFKVKSFNHNTHSVCIETYIQLHQFQSAYAKWTEWKNKKQTQTWQSRTLNSPRWPWCVLCIFDYLHSNFTCYKSIPTWFIAFMSDLIQTTIWFPFQYWKFHFIIAWCVRF